MKIHNSARIPGPKSKQIVFDSKKYVAKSNYVGLYGVALEKGNKSTVYDVDGNKYIDFLGGAAANILGYNNQEIIRAYQETATKIHHSCTPYSLNAQVINLAKKLCNITNIIGDKAVMFGLTGSDSIDGAIKCARKYTNKKIIVSFEKSYHGQTGLSFKASGFNKLSEHIFQRDNFIKVPFPRNREEAKEVIREIKIIFQNYPVAAFLIEPILGDAGCIVPPDNFLKEITRMTTENNIILIDDEIQMGMGRTGKWFAYEHYGIEPDIIVIGKGLSSEYLPISAVIGKKNIINSLDKAEHVFTYSAHPPSCAVASTVIDIMENQDIISNVVIQGIRLQKGLEKIKQDYPTIVKDVRGIGLSQAVEINGVASLVGLRCLSYGLYPGYYGAKNETLRLQPPLNITGEEVNYAIDVIRTVINEIYNNKIPEETKELHKKYCLGLGVI